MEVRAFLTKSRGRDPDKPSINFRFEGVNNFLPIISVWTNAVILYSCSFDHHHSVGRSDLVYCQVYDDKILLETVLTLLNREFKAMANSLGLEDHNLEIVLTCEDKTND